MTAATPSPLLALARRPLRRAMDEARHVTPVPYARADGPVRRVYDAVERDFGMLAPPVAVHSPAPVVLAAVWRLLRSTLLLAGETTRAEREAVAAAVSRANRCPYCVEVHDASRAALSPPDHGDLAAWVSGDGPSPRTATALDELLDVAATFEYLNRVVTVLLPASSVPPAAPPPVRERALAMLGSAARRDAPGRRIAGAPELLDDVAATAHAVLGDPGPVRAAVDRALRSTTPWLEDPSLDAVAGMDSAVRGPARLAVLAATAPWRVTPDVVAAARAGVAPGDRDRVVTALVAAGAVAAARSRHAALAARDSGETRHSVAS